MPGLDGRHRNEDGRIERKRGDTKVKHLKDTYPELRRFPDEMTLGQLRAIYGARSLDGLRRMLRAWRQLERTPA